MALPNHIPAYRKAAGLSQTDLAERIGTTLNMMGKLERGDRTLDTDWLEKIGRALSVPPHKLIEGPPSETFPANENSITLRQFDLSYSMGPGTNIDDYVEEGTHEFDAGTLARLTRAPSNRLFVARGDGDSMFPTLVNDDLVVIDTTQTTLNLQDRIWACSVYGAGAIKRLRTLPGRKVRIISDNPVIEDQEVDAEDVHIVGRVIWLGRRM